MRNLGKYIIRKSGSPYWYIQLPGYPAKSSGIRADDPDPKRARDNEKLVQRMRDKALQGDADARAVLKLDEVRTKKQLAAEGPTLAEWIDVWQKHFQINHAPSSVASMEYAVRYWRGLWGSKALDALHREDALDWRSKFMSGDESVAISPHTGRRLKPSAVSANAYLVVLRLIFSDALNARAARGTDGRYRLAQSGEPSVFWLPDPRDATRAASRHAFLGIAALATPNNAHSKHYSKEQLEAIRAEIDDPEFREFFDFGCSTGQRLNSLINVRRADITPRVAKIGEPLASMVVFRQTKNGKAHAIPIPKALHQRMKALPRTVPGQGEFFFGELHALSPLRARMRVRDLLMRACKKADVPYMRFHWATRATAAMRLHERQCTTLQIMQILNWSSEAQVKRYIPMMPSGLMDLALEILSGKALETEQ